MRVCVKTCFHDWFGAPQLCSEVNITVTSEQQLFNTWPGCRVGERLNSLRPLTHPSFSSSRVGLMNSWSSGVTEKYFIYTVALIPQLHSHKIKQKLCAAHTWVEVGWLHGCVSAARVAHDKYSGFHVCSIIQSRVLYVKQISTRCFQLCRETMQSNVQGPVVIGFLQSCQFISPRRLITRM